MNRMMENDYELSRCKLAATFAGLTQARRSFRKFVKLFAPSKPYYWGRHTREICRILQRGADNFSCGISSRFIINCPPRHGKSDLCSRRFPPWFILNNPDAEIILASYGGMLASDMSRDARDCFERIGQYYDMSIKDDRDRVNSWGVAGAKGGFNAVGIGGSIAGRGAHCLTAGTMISTPDGEKDIAHLVRSGYNGLVWSMNHKSGQVEARRVTAVSARRSSKIFRVEMEGCANVRCTSEHRIWANENYTEASGAEGGTGLRLVREAISAPSIRTCEACEKGPQGHILQSGLLEKTSCYQEQAEVYQVRDTNGAEDETVLRELQANARNVSATEGHQLSDMRQEIQTEEPLNEILLDGLQEQNAVTENADYIGVKEESLSDADRHREADTGEGRECLRDVQINHGAGDASHKRGHIRQSTREPHNALPEMPHITPFVKEIEIHSVVEDSHGEEWVYDLQVEGNHNFFANGLLVHNCLIIDDFLKNRQDAESEVIRNRLWDSFRNDMLTRLAPVHLIVILATRWHSDDLVARIEKEEKRNPNFPRFEKVIFPAQDEETGQYLFPERFSEQWYRNMKAAVGEYAWAALYQQTPIARGGNMLHIYNAQVISASEVPDGLQQTRGWDLASTQKERMKDDPDYTVGVRGGLHRETGIVYVTDVVRGQWGATERDKYIEATALRDGPAVQQIIEGVAGYKDTFERMKRMLSGKSTVTMVTPGKDKVARASILEPPCDAGNIRLVRAEWNEPYLSELAVFPNGAHDDQVDGTVISLWDDLMGEMEEFVM